jgi:hypothetical protein
MYKLWTKFGQHGIKDVASRVAPIYAMLQFNSVIQSLLNWLRQPHLFIGFDMLNDMIDSRHINHLKSKIVKVPNNLMAHGPTRSQSSPVFHI